jgi:hypothetical protein
MYAAIATRPDISFCVTVLSRYNSMPLQMHLTAAKRAIRYLKQTMEYKLHYTTDASGLVMGFSDSDWAGNVVSRKSILEDAFSSALGTSKSQN